MPGNASCCMGVKMKPSGFLVDMMHSIVEFKMMVLKELLRVSSLDSNLLQLILLIFFRRVNLSFE